MMKTTHHIILKAFSRLLIVAVILLSGTAAQAQFEKFIRPNNSYGQLQNRLHTDSAMIPALDTLKSAPDGSIAVKAGIFYVKWTFWHEVTGSGSFIGSNVFVGNAAEATFHDSVLWWKNDTTLIGRKFEFISADNKLAITYPAGSRNTDSTTSLLFTINPANILLSTLGGSLNLSQIAQGSATTGQAIIWNGSVWAPGSVSGSGSELDPISIHNQRAAQANSFFNVNTGTFRDTAFFKGGGYISNYDAAGVNSTWFVFPNGVSGIGQNGTGVDVWIAHAQFGGQFFPDAGADDIAYRNTSHNLLFGTGSGANNSIMQIQHATQTMRITKAATTIITDTTAGKPLVVNTSGQVIGRGYWYAAGAGGATPTLQQVADAGNTSTTGITVQSLQFTTSNITNTSANFINLVGSAGNYIQFSFAGAHNVTIGDGLITADRGYDLPNASGTLALTSQALPTGGTTGQVLSKIDGTDYNVQWTTVSGGGGSPGGVDQQVQFNDGGAFGGSNLKYNKTTGNWGLNATPNGSYKLEITGSVHASASLETATSITAGSSLFQSSVYQQSTGSSPFFEYINSWAGNGSFRWKGASGSTSLLELNGDQTIKAPGYAGTGNRNTYWDANGVLQRGTIDPANIQQTTTVATALTAAGTDQSTALALSGNNSVQEVTTAASGTGVKLPTASSTSRVAVINRGANDLIVYPNTSGVINGQSANAGFTIPAGASAVFIGKDGTAWYMEQAMRGGDVSNSDASKALTINANAVTTTKINDAAVTYAKIQNVTAIRLLGRYTNSNGVAQEITIGSGLALDNTTGALSSTGGMSNPMTTLGDIIYGGTAGAATRLGGNTTTTGKFLLSLGASSAATAPTWDDGLTYFIRNGSASSQTGSLWVSGQIKTDGNVNVGGGVNINSQASIVLGGNPYLYFTNGWSGNGGYKFWGGGGGTLLFQMDYTGILTDPGSLVVGSGDLTGMTDGSKHSVRLDNSANGVNMATFRVNQTASSTSVSTALQPWLRTTHSSGTVADVRTFVAVYDQGSANAVTEARVGEFSALMSNATGGTISTLKMVQASMSANTSTATTITNSYGFFYKAPGGSGTITLTNPTYAFYNDDASAQSLFKGKFFLPSLGTTTPDKSLGYVSSTGEVVPLASVQTAQGSYTPTTSNLTNITSETTGTTYYTRTGNVVSVDGFYSPTVTATGTACSVKFTLPVTSDLTGNDLYGVITSSDNTASGTVTWDATNDKAIIQFKSTVTTPSLNFHFSYRVQ
jgi:hypothetical protein